VSEESKDRLDQLASIHRRTKGEEFERILALYYDKIEKEFEELEKIKQERKTACT
jgi:hypothetical protein